MAPLALQGPPLFPQACAFSVPFIGMLFPWFSRGSICGIFSFFTENTFNYSTINCNLPPPPKKLQPSTSPKKKKNFFNNPQKHLLGFPFLVGSVGFFFVFLDRVSHNPDWPQLPQ